VFILFYTQLALYLPPDEKNDIHIIYYYCRVEPGLLFDTKTDGAKASPGIQQADGLQVVETVWRTPDAGR
jgi:hypothetical protein